MFQSPFHVCSFTNTNLHSSSLLSRSQKIHNPHQSALFSKTSLPFSHLIRNSYGALPSTSSEIRASSAPPTTAASDGERPISTWDYLLSSLDLSPEMIATITKPKHLKLASISNADSLISLFRDHGFTDTDMATIFSACPYLFQHTPKNLKPKLGFLAHYGVAGESLVRAVTADPHVLRISLDNKLAPCLQFLAQFFGNSGAVPALLSIKGGARFVRNFHPTVPQNARTLRVRGVPDSSIVAMMVGSISVLSRRTEVFEEAVREVEEMGFRASSTMFFRGVCAMLLVTREKWVAKTEVLKRFGWTEEQVRALFLKQPTVMALSKERLELTLRLFEERVGWTQAELERYPVVLICSYGGRILPRLAVLHVLLSRGLVKKNCVGNAVKATEANFLNRFVYRYQQNLPHLLRVYESNFR